MSTDPPADPVDELAKLFAAALWAWLPPYVRIPLAVAWPAIKRWVIPAIIQLFAARMASGLKHDAFRAVQADERMNVIEDIAERMDGGLRRRLSQAERGLL